MTDTGVFETLAVVNQRPRLLQRHLARLWEGCRRLGLCAPSESALTARICEQAAMSYVSLQILNDAAWCIARLAARGGKDSVVRTFTVGLGGDYDRVRSDVSVDGRGARSEILSTYLGHGTQVHDIRTLQDHVAPAPRPAVEQLLIEELGRPVTEAFADFDWEPIAAASIGQAYRARLPSGERVIVKVQRPGIADAVGLPVSA